MRGLDLAACLHTEFVAPLLSREFPRLAHAAALIGDGSEVLGYDDAISADHDFGPRLQIFLEDADFLAAASPMVQRLRDVLPETIHGHPVAFADRDRPIGLDAAGFCGSPHHGVEVSTVRAWFRRSLCVAEPEQPGPAEWLAMPSQALLATTAGAVFHDGPGHLTEVRRALAWYPDDIWFHLLACQWTRIAQEQPLIGRCGDVGDEFGSAIIAARLARDLMRLAFLMNRRHAPCALSEVVRHRLCAPARHRVPGGTAAADNRCRQMA